MKYDLKADIAVNPQLVAKIKSRDDYAQSLYAAMCNMQWQHSETFSIQRNDIWSGVGNIVVDLHSVFSVDQDYMPETTVTLEVLNDLRLLGWHSMPWQD
jgi:hypothetical protein